MEYNLLIVLPFYNHLECFSKVARKFSKIKLPVLLINDGSTLENTEGVKKICNDFGFSYIEHKENQGKGGAVLTGLKYAKKNNFTHVLQIDSDGQHDINDIEKFIKASKENLSSIINGSPIYDENAPKSRLIGRKITKFWVWVETRGAKINDTMCGFRIYPLNEISKIIKEIKFKRMGFDIEILVRAAINKINIKNVETNVNYNKGGVSHFRLIRDNIEISFMHFRLCLYAIKKMFF